MITNLTPNAKAVLPILSYFRRLFVFLKPVAMASQAKKQKTDHGSLEAVLHDLENGVKEIKQDGAKKIVMLTLNVDQLNKSNNMLTKELTEKNVKIAHIEECLAKRKEEFNKMDVERKQFEESQVNLKYELYKKDVKFEHFKESQEKLEEKLEDKNEEIKRLEISQIKFKQTEKKLENLVTEKNDQLSHLNDGVKCLEESLNKNEIERKKKDVEDANLEESNNQMTQAPKRYEADVKKKGDEIAQLNFHVSHLKESEARLEEQQDVNVTNLEDIKVKLEKVLNHDKVIIAEKDVKIGCLEESMAHFKLTMKKNEEELKQNIFQNFQLKKYCDELEASIKIKNNKLKEGTEIQQRLASLSRALRASLECHCCHQVPACPGPLPSCPSGHLMCPTCRSTSTTCPTCSTTLGDLTCLLSSPVLEHLEKECPHPLCHLTLPLSKLGQHIMACPHRPVLCPSVPCCDRPPSPISFIMCSRSASSRQGMGSK